MSNAVRGALLSAFVLASPGVLVKAQQPQPTPIPPQAQARPVETVRAVTPPRNPLPPEEKSSKVTRFSFIVYGDTRGRRDGKEIQYEHSLVVDSMLATIKRLENTPQPVRFILQSGDAVVNGGDARQWNASFVNVINRLTGEGGVPYFLAPGNHDVSGASALDSPDRQAGLRNYLSAVSQLIPPDGAARRLSGYPAYAFGYGNTFVIALDSNIAGDDVQFEWASAQLEKLDRQRYKNVVAFFHHPPFSAGPHGGAKIERPTALIRTRYMPLFRAHRVKAIFTGHDHLFDHWVERYLDVASGRTLRMDLIVTGGGGAPLYGNYGEPLLTEYLKLNEGAKVQLEHLARPGLSRGDNPYHYLLVRVDGERMTMEVVGVDWGSDFRPYRSNKVALEDEAGPQQK
ncbi:MAG TPA: metallophosphoesterase [Pyrinomonadaceae bacterium]|nr:metallophosphoesterase [Pyrinomonadaceae bacterium]